MKHSKDTMCKCVWTAKLLCARPQAAHEELMRRYTELKNERIDGLEKVLAVQAEQVCCFECVIDLVSQTWTRKRNLIHFLYRSMARQLPAPAACPTVKDANIRLRGCMNWNMVWLRGRMFATAASAHR